jgi:hypothetical protein
MRPPKYPLDALARLRASRVDDATSELASSERARESAGALRDAAEREQGAHEARAAKERSAADEALARGELRVEDLIHANAWERGVLTESGSLARSVDETRARERSATEDVARARAKTAARKAESNVVAKDEARWQKDRADRIEAHDDEAAAEAHGSRDARDASAKR